MLLQIFLAYFWLQFYCILSVVVDHAVGGKDIQPQIEEDFKFLTDFQKKIQELEETQEILTSKIRTLRKEENTSVNQKRIRRETEEQKIPTSQDNQAVVTSSENRGHQPEPNRPSNTSGSVYVRWGHSECPAHSTLIYSGVAAGADWDAAGNGANYLCLPGDPTYDNPVTGVQSLSSAVWAIVYGYDTHPYLPSGNWTDVPCAVCKAPSRFGQLMIPGKNSCPPAEWTLEYSGYLMSERNHPAHLRSMYICVDREMQSVGGSHGASASNGVIRFVESRCSSSGGGLPCGPYVDGYELTCAVCTQ